MIHTEFFIFSPEYITWYITLFNFLFFIKITFLLCCSLLSPIHVQDILLLLHNVKYAMKEWKKRKIFTIQIWTRPCITFDKLSITNIVLLTLHQWWRSRDLILWVSVSSLKGLVSVSRFKGLGLTRDYSIETQDHSIETQDLKGGKN